MGESYEPSGRGRVNYDNGGGSKMNGTPAVDVDLPDNAKPWEGWGTALKPAFEPIIVARKPFRGTVAANVLAHGTGALNIDATRVPTTDTLGGGATTGAGLATKTAGWDRPWMQDEEAVAAHADRVKANVAKAEKLGRFPTNVLLEQSQAGALDAQTGVLTSGAGNVKRASGADQQGNRGGSLGAESRPAGSVMVSYGDSGGASRFFPTFRYEAKAPSSERPNVEGTVHATVKPLELMRWLVRLVTRRGGRVLDIYAGSGTTGEAALLEG
jgi:site-specific DNA-methyltransferase (adenine-specific)